MYCVIFTIIKIQLTPDTSTWWFLETSNNLTPSGIVPDEKSFLNFLSPFSGQLEDLSFLTNFSTLAPFSFGLPTAW